MITRIHHVAAVVGDLPAALAFWRDGLGLALLREADLPDQGVRAVLLGAGTAEVELLTPTRSDTGVARFHAARGDALHHLCFESDDVGREVARLAGTGVEMIDRRPRGGLAGQIAFLHPGACAGVLVELATPGEPGGLPPAPVEMTTVHARVADVGAASRTWGLLFGLTESLRTPGGSLVQLGLGSVTVQLMTSAPGERPALTAVRLRARDLAAVGERLRAHGAVATRTPVGLVVGPAASGGVPLIIQPDRQPDRGPAREETEA